MDIPPEITIFSYNIAIRQTHHITYPKSSLDPAGIVNLDDETNKTSDYRLSPARDY